jgi:hypothetical protein
MSQLMTGSHSSPLATSDHDFSLFKLTKPAQERTAMAASKKQNQPAATESNVAQPVDRSAFDAAAQAAAAEDMADALVEPDQELTPELTGEQAVAAINKQLDTREASDELARLRAERKAANARIKELSAAAKANRPAKHTKTLDDVIARQAAQPKWLGRFIRGRVAERQRAGQPYDEALDGILAHLRSLAVRPSAAE